MDDTDGKTGPALTEDVQELQGRFETNAALQDAIGRLTLLGFDRADFSMPDADASQAATPDGANAVTDNIDLTQVRTMASGITGTAAGVGVAAVLLATGGVALPIVAAVAGTSAIGAAAVTTGAGVKATEDELKGRDQLGSEGKLILAVRVRSAELLATAQEAMRTAGAVELVGITGREGARTGGVSAVSWTGE